jgi:hypothetical protein
MNLPLPNETVLLIPAAGYGRRVGSPPAKELLPGSDGEPMISRPLRLARERGWSSVVLTRPEKHTLVDYLARQAKQFADIQVELIAETSDWPQTLLQSKHRWRMCNIIYLPDTEFSPESRLDEMAAALANRASVVWAQHWVSNRSTWGCFESVDNDTFRLCEKPVDSDPGTAWGIFGFRPQVGAILLTAQQLSNQDHAFRSLRFSHQEFTLDSFKDLTRV